MYVPADNYSKLNQITVVGLVNSTLVRSIKFMLVTSGLVLTATSRSWLPLISLALVIGSQTSMRKCTTPDRCPTAGRNSSKYFSKDHLQSISLYDMMRKYIVNPNRIFHYGGENVGTFQAQGRKGKCQK